MFINMALISQHLTSWLHLLVTNQSCTTTMSLKQTSLVWVFFTENGDWVTCTKCPKTYKLDTAKSSTQPLCYHLKTQHCVDFNNAEKSLSSKRPAENNLLPSRIFSYTEKKSQQQMYAELAAIDRFSFLQIVNSALIRNSMLKNGMRSHTSSNTIKNKVFQYYDEAKIFYCNFI